MFCTSCISDRTSNESYTFTACNKAVTLRSDTSWWPGYKCVWGHMDGDINRYKCISILVPESDYNALLRFAHRNPCDVVSKSYKMKITQYHNWMGSYWTLSQFSITNRRCLPRD